jgi:hypothetical protein
VKVKVRLMMVVEREGGEVSSHKERERESHSKPQDLVLE